MTSEIIRCNRCHQEIDHLYDFATGLEVIATTKCECFKRWAYGEKPLDKIMKQIDDINDLISKMKGVRHELHKTTSNR